MKFAASAIITAFTFLLGFDTVQGETVACWRFETGPANTSVPHAGGDGAFDGTTSDVSGNGNSLSAWTQGGYAGFAYRADVPFISVPQNGIANNFSVKNTGNYPALFTSAAGSSPSGINAQTITPNQFTIEASYKPVATGGYRTVVGRDAQNVSTVSGNLAALYFQVRPDDSVRLQFTDMAGVTHEAVSPPGLIAGFDAGADPEGVGAPWYQLAATSDGSMLRVYVDNQLVGSTDLTTSGSTNLSLTTGTVSGSDWVTGAWSVGRGLYAGGHTDRAFGFIDEVRVSNTALPVGEFLSAHRPHIGSIAVSGGLLAMTGTRGQPDAMYRVLHSTNAALPSASWTQVGGGTFNGAGGFAFTNAVDPANAENFFLIEAVIPASVSGPLTYQLAGGSESWPAAIRERIVYAMDGAVALYNRYGTFPRHLYANYNPSVPTAQANYDGWIDFGGQIGYRTALHEISHTLGVGTVWNWAGMIQGGNWTGANALQQVQVFDGAGATIGADTQHFWPYGLNQDNEASTENNRRHVLMVTAFRLDLGIQ